MKIAENMASVPVISVGSGKGGVGKTVVASNLALVLARQGKRVVLVDLDIGGPNIHIMFGIFNPEVTLSDFLQKKRDSLNEVAIKLESLHGLKIIAGVGDSLLESNLQYGRKLRLMRAFRKMETDLVIVDVGPGTNYHSLDFFILGDIQLAVTTPDPTSIVDAYRFIKLSAIRKVLSAFVRSDPVYTTVANSEFKSIDQILKAVEKIDKKGRAIAEKAISAFNPGLILNRTSSAQVNTQRLQSLMREYTGRDLIILGSIPEDKAIEKSVFKYMPVVASAPDSNAANSFVNAAGSLKLMLQMIPG